MGKQYFEDYSMGEKLVTPGRTVTETDIILFAGITGDWHQLHTDVTYAKNTDFGERIAHGMLVFAIGSALAIRLGQFVVMPKSFIAAYGTDKLRFPAATKIGDTIHLEMEVVDLIGKTDTMGIVSWQGQVKNQDNVVVCSYITKVACGRKPKDED